MARVFTPPLGLPSLLGAKAVGSAPDELEERVRFAIEGNPYYLAARMTRSSKAHAGFTSAYVNSMVPDSDFTVPEGQVWVPLLQLSIITVLAGDTVRASPVLIDPIGLLAYTHTMATVPSAVASSQGTVALSIDWWKTPLLIPGGYKFASWCWSYTGAGTTVGYVSLHFAALEV